ncbi:MAG TPA: hypothetical protein VG672_09990 [Bryobacteraceae bacterium]|nr:hypothetical protein [Bryobacteraceae bacterium]
MPAIDIPAAFLRTLLRHIAALLLQGAGGDHEDAWTAAETVLLANDPWTLTETSLTARILAFNLQAGEALAQTTLPDLTIRHILRLRGSALALTREAAKAERALEKQKAARGRTRPEKARPEPAQTPPGQAATIQALPIQAGQSRPATQVQAKPGQAQTALASRPEQGQSQPMAQPMAQPVAQPMARPEAGAQSRTGTAAVPEQGQSRPMAQPVARPEAVSQPQAGQPQAGQSQAGQAPLPSAPNAAPGQVQSRPTPQPHPALASLPRPETRLQRPPGTERAPFADRVSAAIEEGFKVLAYAETHRIGIPEAIQRLKSQNPGPAAAT